MKKNKIEHYTTKEALDFHTSGKPGKIEITPSKPMTTKRDLALAYSPGVASPVLEISKNPNLAYDYTSKGNLVAVISNGSAILGLGNLGAAASKPVMEGKAVLFKRFADIDSIDIEIDSKDNDEIINTIKNISSTFGGINLEDIAAPNCFIIEEKLKKIVDIPIFHDDQHGTAIITTAALINALDITGKSIKNVKVVVNGAGASALACTELFKKSGIKNENLIMCDRTGVIYKGRNKVDKWKSKHAINTKFRSLAEAIKGADVFLGLSAKNALTKEMVKSMAKNPIIFACANPDPEIKPEIIENAYYRLFRTIDGMEVVPYGTGSALYTKLSYDLSGNYFDLDTSFLESGYSYGIQFLYHSSGQYKEQPEIFKFRVDDTDTT